MSGLDPPDPTTVATLCLLTEPHGAWLYELLTPAGLTSADC